MRSEVPLYINPLLGRNCAYYGWPRRARIEVGDELMTLLTRAELLALVAHELGHRNLYHLERRWAALVIVVVATAVCSVVWWPFGVLVWIPLALLSDLMRVYHEVEADAYAMRTYRPSLYRRAWEKAREGAPVTWVVRFRRRFIEQMVAERG